MWNIRLNAAAVYNCTNNIEDQTCARFAQDIEVNSQKLGVQAPQNLEFE